MDCRIGHRAHTRHPTFGEDKLILPRACSLKGGNPKRLTRSCFTMRREFKCKSDGRLLSRILALCGFENRELLLGLPLTTSSSRTPNRAGKIVARYVAARSKAGEALNEGLTRPSRHGCRLNMGSKGKVVLITGSTDGVGRLVARRLVDQIHEAGRGSAAFLPADFSSLAEVRRLADALGQDCDRLDVLINNAGTGSGGSGGKRETSQDGYEFALRRQLPRRLPTHQTFAVSYADQQTRANCERLLTWPASDRL